MANPHLRTIVALAFTVVAAGCSGNSSTGPTPTPTPAPVPTPSTFTLSGRVTSTTPNIVVAGATVTIADGPNAGRSVRTDAGGGYSFTGLATSGFTLNASATGYAATATSVTLTSSQTRDFQLTPAPLFAAAGAGNTVFDMPTYVSRVRIQGRWNGTSNSNFIVFVGGRLIVNEILRQSITYDGTHAVVGGVTQVTDSVAIAWSINEVAGLR